MLSPALAALGVAMSACEGGYHVAIPGSKQSSLLLCRAGAVPDVEVAIDPAELEGLDEEGVRALYEERLAAQQSTASREVRRPAHPALQPCLVCPSTFILFLLGFIWPACATSVCSPVQDIALCVGAPSSGTQKKVSGRSVRG
jgi:hypothetical protein